VQCLHAKAKLRKGQNFGNKFYSHAVTVARRFGFPNKEALDAKQTGQACRGEEHEVVIVWSITSGKRQIVMDGKEVYFQSSRTGILDHSWTSRGNHVYKVVCYATPPVQAYPGFRQYDLLIDGQSFFTMPKVYELGLRGGGAAAASRTPGRSGPPNSVKAPKTPAEEEQDLQRAIRASLAESKQHLERKAAPAPAPSLLETESLGMGDPTNPGGADVFAAPPQPYAAAPYGAAPPAQPYGAPAPPAQPYGAAPPAYPAAPYQSPAPAALPYSQPVDPAYPTSNAGAASYPALPPPAPAATDAYYAPPPADPGYAAAAPAAPATQTLFAENYSSAPAPVSYDAYGGAAPVDDPFAPKPPTHSDIASGIMSAYGPTTPAPAAGAPALMSPDAAAPTENGGETPQTNGQGMTMLKFEEEEPLNPFEAAMKHLVNVDHIDQPAAAKLKSNLKKEQEEEEKMKKKGTSKGLPPAAANVVGHQATLGQISEVKEKKEPSKPVMNAAPQLFNPQAQQAGMMVVYGDTSNQNGPPPLQQQGFGVGYNRGYGGGY